MKKRWKFALILRRLLVVALILLELIFLGVIIFEGGEISQAGQILSLMFSLLLSLHVIVQRDNSGYKIMWIFLILLFPAFGGPFYLLATRPIFSKRSQKSLADIEKKTNSFMFLPETACEKIKSDCPSFAKQTAYLQDFVGFPVFENNQTEYFSPGEKFYEKLLVELEKAEKYIFMEYFIVEEGVMWNSILEILKRKVAEGVTVRLIYDDIGCFLTLPNDYPKTLKTYGIECYKFNKFSPFISTEQNNRDHRKITVIDGKVAFTGGINLADEYINEYEKYGHWKDCALMIKGAAAWGFTVIFLQMWQFVSKQEENIQSFYPSSGFDLQISEGGFVQPYADSPMDEENVGEHVYSQIINNAKKYIYINTPYLIIDAAMVSALTLAAKSGVDVRIVTPHRWDKKIVHITTRSYYPELLEAGVKIYEYTDGFMHSKTFISDDTVATVGTINLDYRSLYLHFECGALMYNTKAIGQIKEDFLQTLENCQQITLEDCKANAFKRFGMSILRFFAPLM